jgi:phage terminase large subunit-like protein
MTGGMGGKGLKGWIYLTTGGTEPEGVVKRTVHRIAQILTDWFFYKNPWKSV